MDDGDAGETTRMDSRAARAKAMSEAPATIRSDKDD